MTLRRIALISAAAIAVALPTAASAHSSGLVGEVGPGFTIEVELNGKDLKRIKAGTYTIKIQDKSSEHNFRLRGPGLNRATSVAGTRSATSRMLFTARSAKQPALHIRRRARLTRYPRASRSAQRTLVTAQRT